MSNNKDNYELYRSTFDKVHASDELVRKVKKMAEVKAKNKIHTVRKALCIAIAATFIFVASNVAVYATTGESWVEKIAIRAIFDGEEKDIEINKITDENGNVSYEIPFDYEDKNGSQYTYPPVTIDGKYGDIKKIEFKTTHAPTLIEENGRIYFVEDITWNVKEDITDDFADGKANVTVYEEDGTELVVTIEGTIDEYTLNCIEQ